MATKNEEYYVTDHLYVNAIDITPNTNTMATTSLRKNHDGFENAYGDLNNDIIAALATMQRLKEETALSFKNDGMELNVIGKIESKLTQFQQGLLGVRSNFYYLCSVKEYLVEDSEYAENTIFMAEYKMGQLETCAEDIANLTEYLIDLYLLREDDPEAKKYFGYLQASELAEMAFSNQKGWSKRLDNIDTVIRNEFPEVVAPKEPVITK